MNKLFGEMTQGILLHDGPRKAGKGTDKEGKSFEWEAGYVVSVVPMGDQRGQVKRHLVAPELEESIRKQLETVSWGSVITLRLNGKYITGLTVDLDWASKLLAD